MNFDSFVNVTNNVVDEVVHFVSSINYTAVFKDILITTGNISETIWDNICSPVSFTYVMTAKLEVSIVVANLKIMN